MSGASTQHAKKRPASPGLRNTSRKCSLAAISATGRRVIFYDQQGCGNSDQPDDPGRWTVDFYLREIETVRRALGLERCHILGQSWGGMLLMEYLVTRPTGVVSATISSSPASMPTWIAETGRQRAALDSDRRQHRCRPDPMAHRHCPFFSYILSLAPPRAVATMR